MRALETIPVRTRAIRKTRHALRGWEAREDFPSLIINRGVRDLTLGRERSENSLGAPLVLESNRAGAVGADNIGQHTHVRRERATESDQLVGDERAAHEQKDKAVGQQDDQHQLAFDRRIAQENGHVRNGGRRFGEGLSSRWAGGPDSFVQGR